MGKSTAIIAGRSILLGIPGLKLAPNMITKEAFVLQLKQAGEIVNYGQTIIEQSAVSVFSDEYLVFHRPGDIEFTRNLTDLYDCGNIWEYYARGRMERAQAAGKSPSEGVDTVRAPFTNILGGVTTRSFGETFGPQIGTGFTARLTIAYSEESVKVPDLFTEQEAAFEYAELIEDAKAIAALRGPMSMTLDARRAFQAWYDSGMPPLPTHNNLEEYLVRRPIHWMKLSMLASISRSNSLLIDVEDVEKAKKLLLETEAWMPKAFAHAGKNPFAEHVSEVARWAFVTSRVGKDKTIHEGKVRAHLLTNVPVQYHNIIVDHLVSTGMCSVETGTAPPNRMLRPLRAE